MVFFKKKKKKNTELGLLWGHGNDAKNGTGRGCLRDARCGCGEDGGVVGETAMRRGEEEAVVVVVADGWWLLQ